VRKTTAEIAIDGKAPQHIALLLGDWWTRPDATRISLWRSVAYRATVAKLWSENIAETSEPSVQKLLSVLTIEENKLTDEYERLFVGPAAIPCPPYEAVWRKDRPKHEQGTVIGKSTEQLKQLYRGLGLQLRPDQVELADHIAIELEALAVAWDSGADPILADGLFCQLQRWLPQFCASVVANSYLEFYRILAKITEECFSEDSHSSRLCVVQITNDV
jgi:TorA maturation chaperone TorD